VQLGSGEWDRHDPEELGQRVMCDGVVEREQVSRAGVTEFGGSL
jgi:hypothetical protein